MPARAACPPAPVAPGWSRGDITFALTLMTLVGPAILPLLPAALLPAVAMGWLARRRIGGQTGDILGAAQHLAETAILITASAALT